MGGRYVSRIDHPGHQVSANASPDSPARQGCATPDGLAAQLLLLMDGAWVAARMFGPDNHAAIAAASFRD